MFYSYAYPNILSWLKTALRNPCICFVKCIVSLWSLFLFKLEKELLVWWLNSCLITCFCLFPCYVFCQDTVFFHDCSDYTYIFVSTSTITSVALELSSLRYPIQSWTTLSLPVLTHLYPNLYCLPKLYLCSLLSNVNLPVQYIIPHFPWGSVSLFLSHSKSQEAL